jgi:hypothetical protein
MSFSLQGQCRQCKKKAVYVAPFAKIRTLTMHDGFVGPVKERHAFPITSNVVIPPINIYILKLLVY